MYGFVRASRYSGPTQELDWEMNVDKAFQDKMEAFMSQALEFQAQTAAFQKRVDTFIGVSEKRHEATQTQLQSIRTRLDGIADSLNETKDDVADFERHKKAASS
jgi:hypothetical protein